MIGYFILIGAVSFAVGYLFGRFCAWIDGQDAMTLDDARREAQRIDDYLTRRYLQCHTQSKADLKRSMPASIASPLYTAGSVTPAEAYEISLAASRARSAAR